MPKHCLTCKCDELPDAKSKPEATRVQCNEVMPDGSICPKEAVVITSGKGAKCFDHWMGVPRRRATVEPL